MTQGKIKYYLKVIRKGYKNIPAVLGLANFALIALAGLFAFVLLNYEPANEWHDTTFTLSYAESRSTRGGTVLDLYTTDKRHYVLNHNDEKIRPYLKSGQQYKAVYSDDLFHNIIKGLEDTEKEYLNVDEMRKAFETERGWFVRLLILSVSIWIIINSVYTTFYICNQKKKTKNRRRKKV